MKQTNTCPKCGCKEILRVEDALGERSIPLVLGWFTSVPVTRYVCCDCGYIESWASRHYISDIRKQYEKEQLKK